MKLDDNTRAALHYLTLGVVVILLLMLADRLLSGFGSSSDPAFLTFQHGYLLGDGVNIIDTTSTRGERIALAVVVAVAGAALGGLLVALILGAFGKSSRRIALLSARLILIALLGWGIYAALFVPVHRFFLRDAMVVEWRHAGLLRDLAVPFTRKITLHDGTVEVRPNAGGGTVDLVLTGNDQLRLASMPVAGDPDSTRRQAEAAALAINGFLRSH